MNMKTNISIIALALLCFACEEKLPPQNTPVISINATITDITENAAKCVITINSIEATQKVGVIYGTDQTLQTGTLNASSSYIFGESITVNLTGLQGDTQYYFQAYTVDKVGTSVHSEVGQFKTTLLLYASPTTIAATHAAANYTLQVMVNTAWSIASNQDWCTLQPTSGNGSKEITVSVTENTTGAFRTATLSITSKDQSLQINVEQQSRQVEFGNGITAASSFGGGDGTQASPYLISEAEHLKKLVDDVNMSQSYSGTYFRLTTNIQITADEWIPIGIWSTFSGIFDGNGNTISGVMRSSQYLYFGFFGLIENSQISNLTIAATVENKSSGYSSTGAIVGRATGNNTISKCNISGSVTVFSSYSESFTGGLAGYYYGRIQDCSVSGYVTGNNYITGGIAGEYHSEMPTHAITNCTVSGEVTGRARALGGIVGNNNGLISNCTVSGTVTGRGGSYYTGGIVGVNDGNVTNCTLSASGTVVDHTTSNAYIGGIAGYNGHTGTISDCTNQGTVIGDNASMGHTTGGLVGSNSGEIHTSLNAGRISGNPFSTGSLTGIGSENAAYSCNTNTGSVNGAHTDNEAASLPCPDNHEKRK